MKSSFKKLATTGFVAAALLFSAGCSRDDGKTAGQAVDDSAISAKVKASFAKDPGVRAVDIKVDTYLGTVQLSGFADSAAEKARAEELAKAVPGVKAVENKVVLKTDISQPGVKQPAPPTATPPAKSP
jgi:hyperosmotically inducible periplasmic protein